MFGVRKMRMADLNEHLVCGLCVGYLVDAATIVECLHSFCRSCIMRHFATSNACPVCGQVAHDAKPHCALKSDTRLQDIVNTIIPQPAVKSRCSSRRRKSKIDKESISLSLTISPYIRSKRCPVPAGDIKYLSCSELVPVSVLKKFIRKKFHFPEDLQVELFCLDEFLNDDYVLLDIANLLSYRMTAPLELHYVVYDEESIGRTVDSSSTCHQTLRSTENCSSTTLSSTIEAASPIDHDKKHSNTIQDDSIANRSQNKVSIDLPDDTIESGSYEFEKNVEINRNHTCDRSLIQCNDTSQVSSQYDASKVTTNIDPSHQVYSREMPELSNSSGCNDRVVAEAVSRLALLANNTRNEKSPDTDVTTSRAVIHSQSKNTNGENNSEELFSDEIELSSTVPHEYHRLLIDDSFFSMYESNNWKQTHEKKWNENSNLSLEDSFSAVFENSFKLTQDRSWNKIRDVDNNIKQAQERQFKQHRDKTGYSNNKIMRIVNETENEDNQIAMKRLKLDSKYRMLSLPDDFCSANSFPSPIAANDEKSVFDWFETPKYTILASLDSNRFVPPPIQRRKINIYSPASLLYSDGN